MRSTLFAVLSAASILTTPAIAQQNDEKSAIEAKATEIAGQGNVTNSLTVAPPKS